MYRCKTSFGIFFNKVSLRSVYPPSDMSPAAEDAATAAGLFKIFFTADAGLAIPFFLPFDCLAGFLQGLASRFFPAAPFPLLVNSSRKAAIAACGPQVSLSASYRFSASAMGCVAAATGFESSKANAGAATVTFASRGSNIRKPGMSTSVCRDCVCTRATKVAAACTKQQDQLDHLPATLTWKTCLP